MSKYDRCQMPESEIISVLRNILNSFYFSDKLDYSIGRFAENRICLLKDGDKWQVFIGERGMKTDLEEFSYIDLACVNVMNLLASNDRTFSRMKLKFYSSICEKEYKYLRQAPLSEEAFLEREKRKVRFHAYKKRKHGVTADVKLIITSVKQGSSKED